MTLVQSLYALRKKKITSFNNKNASNSLWIKNAAQIYINIKKKNIKSSSLSLIISTLSYSPHY